MREWGGKLWVIAATAGAAVVLKYFISGSKHAPRAFQ